MRASPYVRSFKIGELLPKDFWIAIEESLILSFNELQSSAPEVQTWDELYDSDAI